MSRAHNVHPYPCRLAASFYMIGNATHDGKFPNTLYLSQFPAAPTDMYGMPQED
jgi:hypothetical protein